MELHYCKSLKTYIQVIAKSDLERKKIHFKYACGVSNSSDGKQHLKVCCPYNDMLLRTERVMLSRNKIANKIDLLPMKKCGEIAESTNRILNGVEVRLMEFPWMAFIQYRRSNSFNLFNKKLLFLRCRWSFEIQMRRHFN